MRGRNQIVGGTDAAPGELPYQVSFYDTKSGYNFHFCGASVYSENVIITAGHCVEGNDYADPKYLHVSFISYTYTGAFIYKYSELTSAKVYRIDDTSYITSCCILHYLTQHNK